MKREEILKDLRKSRKELKLAKAETAKIEEKRKERDNRNKNINETIALLQSCIKMVKGE
jgi:hypothetical protein